MRSVRDWRIAHKTWGECGVIEKYMRVGFRQGGIFHLSSY